MLAAGHRRHCGCGCCCRRCTENTLTRPSTDHQDSVGCGCRASTPGRLRVLLAALYAVNVTLAYLLMLVRVAAAFQEMQWGGFVCSSRPRSRNAAMPELVLTHHQQVPVPEPFCHLTATGGHDVQRWLLRGDRGWLRDRQLPFRGPAFRQGWRRQRLLPAALMMRY